MSRYRSGNRIWNTLSWGELRVESGLTESTYLHGSNWSLFVWVMWITGSDKEKPNHPVYIFKMATVDSEHLSTSDCYSSEHKSVLLAYVGVGTVGCAPTTLPYSYTSYLLSSLHAVSKD